MEESTLERIEDLLIRNAEQYPNQPFLLSDGKSLSYHEVLALVSGYASELSERGVQSGDRVALIFTSEERTVLALFAVFMVGATAAVINSSAKSGALTAMIANCAPSLVVSDTELSIELSNVPTWKLGESHPSAKTWKKGSGPHVKRSFGAKNDSALLLYTSGSSGQPKGVLLSHWNVLFVLQSLQQVFRIGRDERIVNLSPLSFDYGLYNIFLAAFSGCTVIFMGGFRHPGQLVRTVTHSRATRLPLIPSSAAFLLASTNLHRYDLSSVRAITSTGEVFPKAHIERLQSHFPSAKIYSMYGLTECKRVSILPPEDLIAKPFSVGLPLPGTRVTIVNDRGEPVLRPNESGELVVYGPHIMKEYWGDPQGTNERIRIDKDGRRCLYTGDLFKRDEDGYLYFVGRKDDLIKVRGVRLSPREVEEVVYQLHGVQNAALRVELDPRGVTRAVLTVVLADGATLQKADILRHCTDNLEVGKIPDEVEIVDRPCYTSSGKFVRVRGKSVTKSDVFYVPT